MNVTDFNEDKERLLAQLLAEEGFADDSARPETVSKRERQFRNFSEAIKEADIQSQARFQEAGFHSTLKRTIANANIFRRAYNEDTKVAFVDMLMSSEIFFALGIVPFNVEILSTFLANSNTAPKFLDIGEQNHFSRDICSVVRCVEGAAFEDCLPAPDFIACASYCDSASKMMRDLGEKYQTEFFALDVPYDHSHDSVLYIVDQFKAMVAAIEKALKIKLTEDKLRQVVDLTKKSLRFYKKITDLYQNNFSLSPLIKSIDYTVSCLSFLGSKEILEIADLNYRETLKGALSAKGAKTKPRVIWHGLRPFHSDEIINYLEDQCDIDLIFEFNLEYKDLTNLLEIDDPYFFLAKKLAVFSRLGPVDLIQMGKLDVLDQYGIDGVVCFNQWGCRHIISVNQIIRDVLSARNMPLLEIDSDFVDARNYSFSQVKVRIDAFVEILQSRTNSL